MYKDRDNFQVGINHYVPAMALDQGAKDHIVNWRLGVLPASDADGLHNDLDADGAANLTILASAIVPGSGGMGATTTAKYGQNVTMVPSGDPSTGGLDIDVFGWDYLGQPMKETFAIASGITASTAGKKAFKRIEKIVLTNPATGSITADLGWGALYGLPYKVADLLSVNEGGVATYPDAINLGDDVAQQLGAGTGTSTHVVHEDGFITGFVLEYTAAQASAGAALTATLNGAAATGLTFEAPVAAVGATVWNTLDRSAWIAVKRGDVVVFTSGGEGDTGTATLALAYSQGAAALQHPDLTDPQTATTKDPRGLLSPALAPNGTREYFVTALMSNFVNASGNGGLHGIQHFHS